MNPLIHRKQRTVVFLIGFALACFGLLSAVQAVSPAPDGGYPGGNTAEGQNALFSRTTGGFNTAVGFFSLSSDATGQFNTGVGAGALLVNTASQNTAMGAGALLNSSTGDSNTADGAFALMNNGTGYSNTAIGSFTLSNNTLAVRTQLPVSEHYRAILPAVTTQLTAILRSVTPPPGALTPQSVRSLFMRTLRARSIQPLGMARFFATQSAVATQRPVIIRFLTILAAAITLPWALRPAKILPRAITIST